MTVPAFGEAELSRRRFLALGGSLAAAGTLGGLVDPWSALGATRWPKGRLGARDAVRVKQSQFMPVGQFRSWNRALDRVGPANQRGLRATGTKAELDYIDDLRNDLERAGVDRLRFEKVPMRRWTTDSWSLAVAGTPVRTASYIPYSGQTPAGGVSGPLVYVEPGQTPAPGSLAGRIAVFDVPLTVIPLSFFVNLTYDGRQYDPRGELRGEEPYKRPYLHGVHPVLEALAAAGAIGAVGVLDFPAAAADGSYFPYDGVINSLPGIYVDRAAGAVLKDQARAGLPAVLGLPAQVKQVNSKNLIGFIPGESNEIVALHCHTDGSNAIEDNGPAAIVAMAQYLARLPKRALPRTIMILLTTGHFAGGSGSRAFVERHEDDLVKRTNAALTIEHLGLREWNETSPGRMGFTGRYEPGAMFAPGSKALVDASFAALRGGRAAPAGVLKPLNAKGSGDPNDAVWPGEGQYLFGVGDIPTSNYITGPTYLLNWGITTADKVDHTRVRREAIAFTEMILRLGRTPRRSLRRFTLG